MNRTKNQLNEPEVFYKNNMVCNLNEKQFEQLMLRINLHSKALLTVPETMMYTGFGESKVRNMLNHPRCSFVVRNGNKLYANRKLLDRYLDSISGV